MPKEKESQLVESTPDTLRASEMRYRRLFESAQDGILILDSDSGRIVDANPYMSRLLGFEHEYFIGKELWEIGFFSDAAASQAAFSHLQATGYIRYEDLPLKTKDNRQIDVEFVSNVYMADDTKVIQSNIRDITARKELESQLRHSYKLKAIGRLAGGVAHDFNNLLTGILGYCDLITMRLQPGDPIASDIAEIRRCGERAASLTHQLLAFGRKQMLAPQVLDLNYLVQSQKRMLGRLIGEDIEIQTRLADDLGNIRADAGQIEQVIMNLVVNARDAMPTGGHLMIETANVELDENYASCHIDVEPGAYVMVAVSDTGAGMDQATLSRIFEPFFTTKEQGRGTGLGLATVYGIVKQSGGSIWSYSEIDHGTTFKVYLPLVNEDESAPLPVRPIAARGGGETILLAEDDDAIRNLITRILTVNGYHVIATRSGTEALHEFNNSGQHIDLLLTDVVMPSMNGSELFAHLSAARPGLGVVFMSGYTGDAVRQHGTFAEGNSFLQKPFTADALCHKVRSAIDAVEHHPVHTPAHGLAPVSA